MKDLWAALGLMLVMEGTVYALFPQRMVEMMRQIPNVPPLALRSMGIAAVAMGWVIVWFVRHSS